MKNASWIGSTNNNRPEKPIDLAASALTVQQVLGQVALIQQIMGVAMKDGEHYGKIPGCGDKPTLLKPGAEKLCLTFRLAPTYDWDERSMGLGHREYRVQCTLSSILTSAFIGQGIGICSTKESKYRCHQDAAESTDNPADFYQAVLKTAKKRALVDAILTATAASDIFTQDLEDSLDKHPAPIAETLLSSK